MIAYQPIGDSEVEKNYNYSISKYGSDDLYLSGHEQSIRYNRFNGSSKIVKHGIPLVLNWISYKYFEIYFSRNGDIIALHH